MDKTKTVPVTLLKRLGSQPPEFTLPVTLHKLNGVAVQISLRCKALRKTEWADARDERQRAALAALTPEAPQPKAEVPADAKAEADADAEATEAPPAKDGMTAALEAIVAKGYAANVRQGLRDDADLVLVFALGWNLEDDFCADGLIALEDEFGGSLREILASYDKAIFHGRLGN